MSYEKFLLEEFIKNPEQRRKEYIKSSIANETILMMENNNRLERMIWFVENEYEISREQAEDFWDKSRSFINILITKYGVDFYADDISKDQNSIIIIKLKAYQTLLVAKYKKTTRENME